MKKAILLAVLVAGATAVHAQSVFTFTLEGSQEVPPSSSTATGSGIGVLDGNTFEVSLSYSGLTGNPTGAHIHGPAASGFNADVLHPFSVAGKGPTDTLSGTFTYSEGQITDLFNGLHYVNIHSGEFPGGEIRGQIILVPEPGTFVLAGLGLGILLLGCRRKKRQA